MALITGLAIVLAYLLGSIPSAYITARLKKGIDIRDVGSGNVGALNVYRQIGPQYGIAVLAVDAGKGALAVLIGKWLGLPIEFVCVCGFAAVVGHNWPVYIGFKGGRGGATTMGALVPLVPVPFGIGFGIAALTVIVTSNVRLGIIGIALVPLIAWLMGRPPVLVFYSLGLFLFLAAMSVSGVIRDIKRAGVKRGALIDREYHFWQTKKKK